VAECRLCPLFGVSRTLEAAGEDTLREVIEVLETVSQPFIDAEVMALDRPVGPATRAPGQPRLAGGPA
jgi:hypothetical protein